MGHREASPGPEPDPELLAVLCAVPGSRNQPSPLPGPVVRQVGWVLPRRSAVTTQNIRCTGFCWTSCLSLPDVSGPALGACSPPLMQSALRPTLHLQFLTSPSQQPGKVGPPVPMFLMGTWKPRCEAVEAGRIQTTPLTPIWAQQTVASPFGDVDWPDTGLRGAVWRTC